MSRSGELVVVGGGAVGAACAYYAARSGWRVTVIDRGEFGRGCSHGNCGFVCPSHVLPLAAPGAIWPALKALFQPNGPLKIRVRLDPPLWSWLLRFARRCNERDMLATGHALQSMLNASRALYGELIRTEQMDCEWEERGMLLVFRTKAAFDHYEATDLLLRDTFGMAATRYDGAALTELEPALKPGLAGAWHYPSDAHLRPDKLMTAWRGVLDRIGVTVREHCAFQDLARQGRRVSAVDTSAGSIPCDAVVLAMGAWTPLHQRLLGCPIPIQPGKGYSITMPRLRLCPRLPLIFEEHRVAITPMQSGYRIGSTMEFAGYDASLNRARLQLLREGASHYLREPFAEPVQEEWFGWRPMVYDGKPLVGPVPTFENVFLAAGHGMLGVTLAASTGKLIGELLGGQAPHIDPAPFAVTRFC